MTDRLDFEARLESRLRARAAVAARPFDAGEIARDVLAPSHAGDSIALRWGALPRGLRWSVVALALAGATLGTLAIGGPILEQPVKHGVVSNGWIAFANKGWQRVSDSDIWIVRPGSEERALIGFPGDDMWQACPAFSPDGTRLAYLRHSMIGDNVEREIVAVTFDAMAGQVRDERVLARQRGAGCPRWSPDGSRLAFSFVPSSGEDEASHLWVVGLDGTSSEIFSYPVSGERTTFDWSPDGTEVAVAAEEKLWIVSADGNASRVAYEAGEMVRISDLRWSPDGTRIAFASTRYTPSAEPETGPTIEDLPYRILSLEGSAPPTELDGSGVSWSPDGLRIAYERRWTRYGISWGGELVVATRDGGNPVVLAGDERAIGGVHFSPDGRQILYFAAENVLGMSGAVTVVSAAGGAEPVELTKQHYFEHSSDLDLSWQAVHGATLEQLGFATPAPASGPTIHRWPGVRGDSGPGLYAWDLEGGAWMDNVSAPYAGARVRFGRLGYVSTFDMDERAGIEVEVAGHQATYREAPADALGIRRL